MEWRRYQMKESCKPPNELWSSSSSSSSSHSALTSQMTSHGMPWPCSLYSTGLQLFTDFRMQSEVARLRHAVGIWHGRHTLVGEWHHDAMMRNRAYCHLFVWHHKVAFHSEQIRSSIWNRLELQSVETQSQPTCTNSCNRATWAKDLGFWPWVFLSFSLWQEDQFPWWLRSAWQCHWVILGVFGCFRSIRLVLWGDIH